MPNSARRQLGLETEKLRIKTENENSPSHDLHLGQDVMMQDHTSKRWSPVVITRLSKQPRSYQVTTRDKVTYRKTQAYLKPSKLAFKNAKSAKSCNMQPLEQTCDKNNTNDTMAKSRHRRTIRVPVKINL